MWNKLTKLSRPKLGLILASAETVYVLAIGVFMTHADSIFGPLSGILGPGVFLMVFVVSAAVSALLVFGYPAYFAVERRWAEACGVAGWTVGWLLILTVLALLLFSALT